MRQMKDSGIEWIGEIPEGWKVSHLGYYTSKIGSGKTPLGGAEAYASDGVLFIRSQNVLYGKLNIDDSAYISDEIDKEMSHTRVFKGDILLNITGASIGRSCIYDKEYHANINQHVCIIRCNTNIVDNRFIIYIILSDIGQTYIKYIQNGANREGLNFSQVHHCPIPFPFLAEQQRIADYLDAKCAHIDQCLELTRQSMEKLRTYKLSCITEAVTKGLDPDVPLKDSGVPWIGQIPAGWEMQRFSTVATVKSNLVSPESFLNLPQISPENIEKNSGKIIQYTSVLNSGVTSNNHLFFKGQILYSKIRPTLNKVAIAPFDGLCSADMYPIECSINKFYLIYAMLSEYFVSQVKQITELRVKMPKINQSELSKIILCIPPLPEQERIAAYLDKKCARIDALLEEKQALLDKLAEYKKSLIFECVTGKREVPSCWNR